MKRCKALVGAAALGCLAAAPAWSQDSGFYVGGAFGKSDQKDICKDVTVSCDKSDTAWKILGGYQFNRILGVEVGYTDLGEVKANGTQGGVAIDATSKASAWELVAVGMLPLGAKFSIYGKAGAYYAKTDNRATAAVPGFSSSGSASDKNHDITWGFGVRYDVLRNLAVRAEWQQYNDVGGQNTGKTDIDVLSIGALYRF